MELGKPVRNLNVSIKNEILGKKSGEVLYLNRKLVTNKSGTHSKASESTMAESRVFKKNYYYSNQISKNMGSMRKSHDSSGKIYNAK